MIGIPDYKAVTETIQQIKGRLGLIVLHGITRCWACSQESEEHRFHPNCVARHWGPVLISLMKPTNYFQGTISYFGLELSIESMLTEEEQSVAFCGIDYAIGKMIAAKHTTAFWPCLFNFAVISSQMRQVCLKRSIINCLLCLETLSYTEFGNENRFPIPVICMDIYHESLRGHTMMRQKEAIRDVFNLIQVRLYRRDEHEWVNLLTEMEVEEQMARVRLIDSHGPGTGV